MTAEFWPGNVRLAGIVTNGQLRAAGKSIRLSRGVLDRGELARLSAVIYATADLAELVPRLDIASPVRHLRIGETGL